jgi:hypothetical protein
MREIQPRLFLTVLDEPCNPEVAIRTAPHLNSHIVQLTEKAMSAGSTDVRELTSDEINFVSGGETPAQMHNRAMSDVIGGGAAGAVAGGIAGSVVPGAGTLAGAVVGGLSGMFAGAVKFTVDTYMQKAAKLN